LHKGVDGENTTKLVSTTTNDGACSYWHEGHEDRFFVPEHVVDQCVEKTARSLEERGDKSGMVQGYT